MNEWTSRKYRIIQYNKLNKRNVYKIFSKFKLATPSYFLPLKFSSIQYELVWKRSLICHRETDKTTHGEAENITKLLLETPEAF